MMTLKTQSSGTDKDLDLIVNDGAWDVFKELKYLTA